MPIIQEAFYIPDDIAVGLASGIYKRVGGVVRWATGAKKGQIVKHLDPISIKKPANSIKQNALKNKKALKITGAIVLTTVAVGSIFVGINYNKQKKFQEAFRDYIEAVRNGDMTLDLIEALEDSLTSIKSIKMSPDELLTLVKYIHDYTMKLAKDNNIEIESSSDNNPIINIQDYLKVQKEIFESA